MKFSPGKVPTFGDFSQDISWCKVRQDFIRFRFKIIKQVGEFQKNCQKNMKYWHLPWGKKHYFFASHTNRYLLKMGGTRATYSVLVSIESDTHFYTLLETTHHPTPLQPRSLRRPEKVSPETPSNYYYYCYYYYY